VRRSKPGNARRQPEPEDPPRGRANKRPGHGTYDNDRPPIVGSVGRRTGEVRLRVISMNMSQFALCMPSKFSLCLLRKRRLRREGRWYKCSQALGRWGLLCLAWRDYSQRYSVVLIPFVGTSCPAIRDPLAGPPPAPGSTFANTAVRALKPTSRARATLGTLIQISPIRRYSSMTPRRSVESKIR
jgi:hypothetical protein